MLLLRLRTLQSLLCVVHLHDLLLPSSHLPPVPLVLMVITQQMQQTVYQQQRDALLYGEHRRHGSAATSIRRLFLCKLRLSFIALHAFLHRHSTSSTHAEHTTSSPTTQQVAPRGAVYSSAATVDKHHAALTIQQCQTLPRRSLCPPRTASARNSALSQYRPTAGLTLGTPLTLG
jgi:hypothetical protein